MLLVLSCSQSEKKMPRAAALLLLAVLFFICVSYTTISAWGLLVEQQQSNDQQCSAPTALIDYDNENMDVDSITTVPERENDVHRIAEIRNTLSKFSFGYFDVAAGTDHAKLTASGTLSTHTMVASVDGFAMTWYIANVYRARVILIFMPNSTYAEADDFVGANNDCATPSSFCHSVDGIGIGAHFTNISQLYIHPDKSRMYISDQNCVREVVIATRNVTTLVGNCEAPPGYRNGNKDTALFNRPMGLAYSTTKQELYIVDSGNNCIRILNSSGVVSDYAGVCNSDQPGLVEGYRTLARFSAPEDLLIDIYDNLFVLQRYASYEGVISAVNASTGIVSTMVRGLSDVRSIALQYTQAVNNNSSVTIFVSAENTLYMIGCDTNCATNKTKYGIDPNGTGNSYTSAVDACFMDPTNLAGIVTLPCSFAYPDLDDDGFGDPSAGPVEICALTAPPGYAFNNNDCNDRERAAYTGAAEVCDQIDNNCNGLMDEGLPLYTYYVDRDHDTFGSKSSYVEVCDPSPPPGYSSNNLDCDDTNPSITTCPPTGQSSSDRSSPMPVNTGSSSSSHDSAAAGSSAAKKKNTVIIVAVLCSLVVAVLLVIAVAVVVLVGFAIAYKHLTFTPVSAANPNMMAGAPWRRSRRHEGSIVDHAETASEIPTITSTYTTKSSTSTEGAPAPYTFAPDSSGGNVMNSFTGVSPISSGGMIPAALGSGDSRRGAPAFSPRVPLTPAVLAKIAEIRAAVPDLVEVFNDEIIDIEKIGKGAQSIVFKSKWNGQIVAAKKLKTVVMNDEKTVLSVLDDLKNEIQLLTSLRHNNIVGLLGAAITPPNLVLLTEYMDAGSLSSVLYHQNKKIKLTWIHKVQLLTDIARGLEFIHSRRTIHRDMKSDNILLATKEEHNVQVEPKPTATNLIAKISDLGISKRKAESTETEHLSILNTRHVGTSFWMAPEVTVGDKYDTSCDVYSFAIIMSEMLSGKMPYHDHKNKFSAHVEASQDESVRPTIEPIKANEARYPHSTETYIELMKQCWKHDPKARPTMIAIVRQLKIIEEIALEEHKATRRSLLRK